MLGAVVRLLTEVIGETVRQSIDAAVERLEQAHARERDTLVERFEAALERQDARLHEVLEHQARQHAEELHVILHDALAQRPAPETSPTTHTAGALDELQETLRMGFGELRGALDRHHHTLMSVVRAELLPLAQAARNHLNRPHERDTHLPQRLAQDHYQWRLYTVAAAGASFFAGMLVNNWIERRIRQGFLRQQLSPAAGHGHGALIMAEMPHRNLLTAITGCAIGLGLGATAGVWWGRRIPGHIFRDGEDWYVDEPVLRELQRRIHWSGGRRPGLHLRALRPGRHQAPADGPRHCLDSPATCSRCVRCSAPARRSSSSCSTWRSTASASSS
jgi:hypothetical protein